MQHVLETIASAQKRYENAHKNSKTRQCITELSKRICFYGKVMDVLVQQHPAYVALAWGAMKLVVGVGIHCTWRQATTADDLYTGTRLSLNTKTWEELSSQVSVMSPMCFPE